MRQAGKLLVVSVLLGSVATSAAAQSGEQDRRLSDPDLVDAARAGVVFLFADHREQGRVSTGSGFLVGPNLLVTNFHVIEGVCEVLRQGAAEATFTVRADDGSALGEPVVVSWSERTDLALLRLVNARTATLSVADSDRVRLGEEVVALGYPWAAGLGFSLTFTKGNVSAKRQRESLQLLQHTASVAPGSSGGPLLNNLGQVVGVNTAVQAVEVGRAIVPLAGNVNLAMPSNYIREMQQGSGNEVPLRAFCRTRAPTPQRESPGAAEMIYQSPPTCLSAGTRKSFTGELQAGRPYVFAVRRTGGDGQLVFGVWHVDGSGFEGTDQERNGMLTLQYTPQRDGRHDLVVGAQRGGDRVCFVLAVVRSERGSTP